MNKTLTCKRCGSIFQGHHMRKFCDECRILNKRERDFRRYYEHREHYLECNRRYRADNHERELERNRRYDATHREQRREKSKLYRETHREELRLKDFERYYRDHEKTLARKRLTMRRFHARHSYRIKILHKIKRIDNGQPTRPFCQHCGKTFKPTYKGEKYCSDACRKQSPLYRVWQRIQARHGY